MTTQALRIPPARLGNAIVRPGACPASRTAKPKANPKPSPPAWVVGVTTAPRSQPTLERTLRSLLLAGWRDVRIFADGPVDLPAIDGMQLALTRRDTPAGAWANWVSAAVELVSREPNSRRILIVQDDAVFCRNVRGYLDQTDVPRDGLVSIYTAVGRESTHRGFHRTAPRMGGVGALAYAFTPDLLRRILADDRFWGHRRGETRWPSHKHIDSAIYEAIGRLGLSEYTHTPSLCQHIADVSTLGHGGATGIRRSGSFAGENFDALTLLRPAAPRPQTPKHTNGQKPGRLACIHRGASTRRLNVPGCSSPPLVHPCSMHGECVLVDEGGRRGAAVKASGLTICRHCPQRTAEAPAPAPAAPRTAPDERHNAFRSPGAQWITASDLARDTLKLVEQLPVGITAVAGVARSGIPSAALLSTHLHLPLFSLSKDGLVHCGHGGRFDPAALGGALGHVLIVDDTTSSGSAMRRARQIMAAKHASVRATFAAIYHNPPARPAPDLWAIALPTPHLLEWCFMNSGYGARSGYDFDGIFCRNPTPGESDDGPRFSQWLDAVPASAYLPRRRPVPLILTACLEKYRPQREAWMQRHGIRCARMIMGPWRTAAERSRVDIAAWKAEQLQLHGRELLLYVESEPHLARAISELSGLPVLCPQAAWIY